MYARAWLLPILFVSTIVVLACDQKEATERSRPLGGSNEVVSWSRMLVVRHRYDPVAPISELYVVKKDGSGETRLITTSSYIQSLAVSPSGKRLAFIAWDPREASDLPGEEVQRLNSGEIWVMNVDGTGLSEVSQGANALSHLTWSPDGRRLAYISRRDQEGEVRNIRDLNILELDGGRLQRIARNLGAVDPEYSWSPDGGRIVFTQQIGARTELHIIGFGGTAALNLSQTKETDHAPAWSPDGRFIAFLSRGPAGVEGAGLWTVRTDGSRRKLIIGGIGGGCLPATWSPDARRLTFQAFDGNQVRLFLAHPDGTKKRPLTQGGSSAFCPVWAPSGDAISFVTPVAGSPSEVNVYVASLDDGTVTRVTTSPVPFPPMLSWLPE